MKQCPICQRVFADQTLNFCLEHGERLREVISAADAPTEVISLPIASGEPPTMLYTGSSIVSAQAAYIPVEAPVNSIAVLPFAHLSSDPDDEYFCDGLAEDLINALARVEGLKVVSRTSTFSFKGKQVEIGRIGSILNVQHLVEGSVRKFGDRMRIIVQLINASDGYHLWSEKYDTAMRDLFDVQDEITASVVKALKTKLLGRPQDSDQMAALLQDLKQHASDVEAYRLLLRGRFYFNKFTPEDFNRALDCYQRAIEIDPNYAAAYAAIAEAYVFLTEFGPVAPLEGMPRARDAAKKALALDPALPEAHASLAVVLSEFEHDFVAAEEEYRQALELNPNDSMTLEYFGGLLCQLGRFSEAETQFRKALELSPLSAMANWIYPYGLFFERRYEECIERAKWVLDLEPNFTAALLVLSFAYQVKGDFASCADAYARFLVSCGLPDLASRGREAFDTDGWEGFLRAMVAEDSRAAISAYITAVYLAALGENETALDLLEHSFERREGYIVMLKVDPRFDALGENPRFTALLSKVGLT